MHPQRVELTERVAAALRAAVRAAGPREMVMLLGGQRRGTTAAVLAALPLPNAAGGADRFAVDSPAFLRAEHELRRRGHAWLGFAHSHPNGAPLPSTTDRRELWRDCVQLILAPQDDRSIALRAFVLGADDLRSLPLSVVDRSTPGDSAAQGADAEASSP